MTHEFMLCDGYQHQLRLMRMLRMLKLHSKVAQLAAEFSLVFGTIARLVQVLFWMVVRGVVFTSLMCHVPTCPIDDPHPARPD